MATSAEEALYQEYTLESDEFIQHFCDLCIQDDDRIEAKAFCTICLQYICSQCLKAHSRANASKTHPILTGKNIPNKESGVEIKPKCAKHHGKILTSFCRGHNSACCDECIILSHGSCEQIVQLSKLSSNPNIKEEFELKTNNLYCLLGEFQRLKDTTKTQISDLDSKKYDILRKIKDSRQLLNQHLDKIEAAMVASLDEKIVYGNKDLEKQNTEINCFITELNKQTREHEYLLKNGSLDQIMLASIEIEAELQKFNSALREHSKRFIVVEATYTENYKLQKMIDQLDTFGSISLIDDKNIQRPYMERSAVYLTDLELKSSSDKENVTVHATDVLPSGDFLVTDKNNRKVTLFSRSYKILDRVELTSPPSGMVVLSMDDKVSIIKEPSLLALSIDQLTNKIKVGQITKTQLGYTRLLKYSTNIIALCIASSFVYFDVLNRDGERVRRIRKEPSTGGIFTGIFNMCLSPDERVVYVADKDNGCIGMNQEGDVVFQYKDAGKELLSTTGVCADPDGFVYVSAFNTNGSGSIVMVTDKGEKVKEVLHMQNFGPVNIEYKKEVNILFVKIASDNVLKLFSLI